MKFEVYKKGKLVKDFTLSGAGIFGLDRIPLRDAKAISFKNGILECEGGKADSMGLSLLWDIDNFGKVMLSTTRLPQRQRPYILNVELARGKLMNITIKREDWSMFDQENGLNDLIQQGENLFIKALENINDAPKAASFADESLEKTLEFSEKLTNRHADIFFEARRKNRGFARSSLACRIDLECINEPDYLKGAQELFAHISMPVNWAQIEPVQGAYDFSKLDRCIDIFSQKRILISAGPLISFTPRFLPEWLMREMGSFEKIREATYEFISRIVTRYSKYVHIWQVISGMNAYNYFKFSFDRILEMTRTTCLAAKESGARSLKMIEIVSPWGQYYAQDPDTIPPLVYADMVTQAGINFDAFGLQMLFGKNAEGMHIRDMMQISALLDYFANVPRPLHITAVAVPDNCGTDQQDCELAGMWHRPWDQGLQSEWIGQFFRIALSKPFINSVTYSTLADGGSSDVIAGSGLLTENMKPKKAFMAIAKLQKQILKQPSR